MPPLRPPGRSGDILPPRRPTPQRAERDEYPSPDDIERFNSVTRTCPHCKKEVFDDTALCYHCGHALDAREDRRAPKPWVIIAALLILLSLFSLIFFFR